MINNRDLLLGLLVIVLWALNAPVIKYITLEVTPFTGLSLCVALTCAIFAPFFRWPGKQQFLVMVQVAMLMSVLHWGSLIWSIEQLDVSTASIMLQTQIIFTVLLGIFAFKEKVYWRTGIGILLGIIGIIILVGMPKSPPPIMGIIGILFSMLMVALAYARQKAIKDISPTNYIAHLHVIAILPVLLLTYIIEKPLQTDWSAINYKILIPMLTYQAFCVSFAHMLWARLIKRNQMSILPNLTMLIPVIGVILGIILFNDQLSPTTIFGGLLTTIGVGVIMMRKTQKNIEVKEPNA